MVTLEELPGCFPRGREGAHVSRSRWHFPRPSVDSSHPAGARCLAPWTVCREGMMSCQGSRSHGFFVGAGLSRSFFLDTGLWGVVFCLHCGLLSLLWHFCFRVSGRRTWASPLRFAAGGHRGRWHRPVGRAGAGEVSGCTAATAEASARPREALEPQQASVVQVRPGVGPRPAS